MNIPLLTALLGSSAPQQLAVVEPDAGLDFAKILNAAPAQAVASNPAQPQAVALQPTLSIAAPATSIAGLPVLPELGQLTSPPHVAAPKAGAIAATGKMAAKGGRDLPVLPVLPGLPNPAIAAPVIAAEIRPARAAGEGEHKQAAEKAQTAEVSLLALPTPFVPTPLAATPLAATPLTPAHQPQLTVSERKPAPTAAPTPAAAPVATFAKVSAAPSNSLVPAPLSEPLAVAAPPVAAFSAAVASPASTPVQTATPAPAVPAPVAIATAAPLAEHQLASSAPLTLPLAPTPARGEKMRAAKDQPSLAAAMQPVRTEAAPAPETQAAAIPLNRALHERGTVFARTPAPIAPPPQSAPQLMEPAAPAAESAPPAAINEQIAAPEIELAAVIDRLVLTRSQSREGRSEVTVPHPDFGRVTLALSLAEQDKLGLTMPDAPPELRAALGQAFAPPPRSEQPVAAAPAEQSLAGSADQRRDPGAASGGTPGNQQGRTDQPRPGNSNSATGRAGQPDNPREDRRNAHGRGVLA